MELITIRTFDNYITANITLSKLQDCGIECFLKDELTGTIIPLYGIAIGGIKLIVKDTDVKEATDILQKVDTEYLNSMHCPKCGNTGLDYISKQGATNFITAILTWILGSYAIAPQHVYKCANCNWEAKALPEEEKIS